MPEDRTDDLVQRYRDWYFGPQDGQCPGCGERWEKDRTGRVDSVLNHNPRCDYIRWVDEEDAKNEGIYEGKLTEVDGEIIIEGRKID